MGICLPESTVDGALAEAGADAALPDARARDSALSDTSATDRRAQDTLPADAGIVEAALADAAASDGAAADTVRADRSSPDLALPDLRLPDQAQPDRWSADQRQGDAGPCATATCPLNSSCEPLADGGYRCSCSGVVCDDVCRAPNACGGCAALSAAPGDSCGINGCGSYTCSGTEALSCEGDHVLSPYYPDEDDDGYGDSSRGVQACQPPLSSWVTRGGDCNDSMPAVHPGAGFQIEPRDDTGDFDYDCSGSEERQHTMSGAYACEDCTPTEPDPGPLGLRECSRCSRNYMFCLVDFDIDPDSCSACCSSGDDCTDCATSNPIYQLSCTCLPTDTGASAVEPSGDCPIAVCFGKRVTTGWVAGAPPACGGSGTYRVATAGSGTCVPSESTCSDIYSSTPYTQGCR